MLKGIMRNNTVKESEVILGDKKVTIPKVTPKHWKQLFGAIETLPNIIIQIATAPGKDLTAYILTGIDIALDEMLAITSILTGIDVEYLEENAGVTEIIEFFTRVAEKNDLSRTIKNVKSLLPIQAKE